MQKIIAADKIFTGEKWLTDHAIIIEQNIVADIVSSTGIKANNHYKNCIIAPAFIDVQVYGAAGKLLGAYPTADTLKTMYDCFSKQGCLLFQPTVATNSIEIFRKSIDAVRQYRSDKGMGVYGLHLEGPWINPGKSGAHVKDFIHSPSIEEVKDLLHYGKDVITMITLAPEVCSREVIDYLLAHNIIISAGHSNATYEQAIEAFNIGITTATHLYNAMSGLHHRSPGLTGAIFNHPSVFASIIPDGHHVDYAAISIAKKIMKERLFAITDAVTETSQGIYQHTAAGDKYECNGTLSGSSLSMHQCFINLVKNVGIDIGEALRMCSLYPANVLRCNDSYGQINVGSKAAFVVLNETLQLTDVVNGTMN